MPEAPVLSDAALIYGGEKLPAVLRDGSHIEVSLRLIRLSEIPAFLDLYASDETKALVHCVAAPLPFDPDALTDESYTALIEANTRLNFTRALARSRERLARVEKSGGDLLKLMQETHSLLAAFSPKSPSPEAGGQTSSNG